MMVECEAGLAGKECKDASEGLVKSFIGKREQRRKGGRKGLGTKLGTIV